LIQYAIESKKYQNLDIGLTADQSKKIIGFEPIPSCMDVYTKGVMTHSLLRAASLLLTATITSESKFKIKLCKEN
jgi:hypothetical protein